MIQFDKVVCDVIGIVKEDLHVESGSESLESTFWPKISFLMAKLGRIVVFRPPLDSRTVIVLPTEIFFGFTFRPPYHIVIKLFQKVPNFQGYDGKTFISNLHTRLKTLQVKPS